MESGIADCFPDYAMLHPGYLLNKPLFEKERLGRSFRTVVRAGRIQ
jgi:hypothetical protein